VVAAFIAQIGLGSQPAFTLPAYEVRSLLELPLYLGLGLGASVVALTYKQSISTAQNLFNGKLKALAFFGKIPKPIQPVIGGFLVGLVALKYPQILGIGYGTVEAILQDQEFSLYLLLGLMVLKLLATAISSASGFVGGLFAPAMFLGASLGSAYGKFLSLIFPGVAEYMAAPPAYAMVGMAAVLAASVRAPLTAILMLFELTRDYRIVLPLMAAVGLSIWLMELIKPTVSSNVNLQQIGLAELKDHKLEVIQTTSVAEAIHFHPKKIPANLSVLEAALEMIHDHVPSALVIDANEKLVGIVSLDDINRTLSRWENYQTPSDQLKPDFFGQTILDICTTDILYAWQDEPLSEALDRMALRGLQQLPVLDRHNPDCIVGLLEQKEIALTCNLATTRKAVEPYLSKDC
jgi:CBS domain-containing protein